MNCPPCGPIQPPNVIEQEVDTYYKPYTFSIGDNVAVKNPIDLKWIYGIITEYDTITNSYTVYSNPIYIRVKHTDMYINAPCPVNDP